MMTAAGRPELIDDPRMTTPGGRRQHLDELFDILQAWASTVPDADTAEEILSHHKLATGQVRTVRDICDSDWSAARHATVAISDRGGGTFRIPNSPWRFAGSDPGIVGSVRFRGEDNRAVLTELLGYDEATIDRLEADGVLSSRVPATATD
jgi:crotonobetainyl-CoA:carnitine CoA-transferase CaiB-like acyl-CoA transferase